MKKREAGAYFWKNKKRIGSGKRYSLGFKKSKTDGLRFSRTVLCVIFLAEVNFWRGVEAKNDGGRSSGRTYGYSADGGFGDTIRTSSYSLTCYSCMSSYLESEWSYIAHMYKRPLSFSDACNFEELDVSRLRMKNCSDMCIWLRMEDRLGGRIRYGYLRGCMSDVLNYNHTTVRFLTYRTKCTYVKFKDIFVRGGDYGFKTDEYAMLCACHSNSCNGGASGILNSFTAPNLVLNLHKILGRYLSSIDCFSLSSLILLTSNAVICLLMNRIGMGL